MTPVRCVSPEAPAKLEATVASQARRHAGGIRLGVLDNSKSNADHLLQFLLDSACASLPVAAALKRRKPTASRPAAAEVIEDLARDTDFVLSAMAD